MPKVNNTQITLDFRLISAARAKHGKIFPCGNRPTLADSFTYADGNVFFRFNTQDGNTKMTSIKMTSIKITDQNIKEAEEVV